MSSVVDISQPQVSARVQPWDGMDNTRAEPVVHLLWVKMGRGAWAAFRLGGDAERCIWWADGPAAPVLTALPRCLLGWVVVHKKDAGNDEWSF